MKQVGGLKLLNTIQLELYLVILDHPLVSVWRYQMLYNTIWPPDDEHNSARNL